MYIIWNLLNGLSVIMSLCLISLPVPGVANIVQSIIMQMIFLDILQTDDWLTPFFKRVNKDDEGNTL